jgi:hypothetical protein
MAIGLWSPTRACSFLTGSRQPGLRDPTSAHPTVTGLFQRAMALKIPHNYFAVWMVTPSRELGGSRPVDLFKDSRAPLRRALEAFGSR